MFGRECRCSRLFSHCRSQLAVDWDRWTFSEHPFRCGDWCWRPLWEFLRFLHLSIEKQNVMHSCTIWSNLYSFQETYRFAVQGRWETYIKTNLYSGNHERNYRNEKNNRMPDWMTLDDYYYSHSAFRHLVPVVTVFFPTGARPPCTLGGFCFYFFCFFILPMLQLCRDTETYGDKYNLDISTEVFATLCNAKLLQLY